MNYCLLIYRTGNYSRIKSAISNPKSAIMNKIQTTLNEIKKQTPKQVMWLVLFAVFLVAIVLAVLFFTRKTDVAPTAKPAELVLAFEPAEIDWRGVTVGDSKTQQITVSATGTTDGIVSFPSIELSQQINGLSVDDTCVKSNGVPCSITLTWMPTKALIETGVKILVKFHSPNLPEDIAEKMSETAEIPVAVSAIAPPAPPPPVVSEPAPAPAAEPVYNPVADTVETLAPTLPEPPPVVLPAPTPAPMPTPTPAKESCFEFAFGGFDAYGKQIGWIRPFGGSYKFHPFSDKDCSNPTGEYNPDTGFITDINNPGRKIGSDSDHVGFIATGATIPALSNPVSARPAPAPRAASAPTMGSVRLSDMPNSKFKSNPDQDRYKPSTLGKYTAEDDRADDLNATVSSRPYDRSFVLRQYKPIPATIVSEVRADPKTVGNLPVSATVDRNVFADNGRTVIIPAGTLMLGYVTGDLPGPYKAIGRMKIEWYQFVRPDGVEFNFDPNKNPFSGDSQGRVGVPGHGSTDYMEQFIMPMITAIVPAAVNMIAPISDRFVNQINLDNNTVTQSGQVRSSELAKNEIITAWNKVAQRLIVDMLDNTVPPFSIAAGTRITVYSPTDLIITCGAPDDNNPMGNKNCAIAEFNQRGPQSFPRGGPGQAGSKIDAVDYSGPDWVGQVRSFDLGRFCGPNGTVNQNAIADMKSEDFAKLNLDYRTIVAYCQSSQYEAIHNAQQAAVFANQQNVNNTASVAAVSAQGTQAYNQQVLGLQYNPDGSIKNPFQKEAAPAAQPAVASQALLCEDGTPPSANGCCTGETFTDMGDQGWNCCPAGGGDCFPPLM